MLHTAEIIVTFWTLKDDPALDKETTDLGKLVDISSSCKFMTQSILDWKNSSDLLKFCKFQSSIETGKKGVFSIEIAFATLIFRLKKTRKSIEKKNRNRLKINTKIYWKKKQKIDWKFNWIFNDLWG